MEKTFVEALTEASVEVTSVEFSVEAFTEASEEVTSGKASTTKSRGSYFHIAFVEASMLPWKLFMKASKCNTR